MIGEVHVVGNTVYLQVNANGTLERLPEMSWYRVLWLYLLNRFGRVKTIGEVRDYVRRKRRRKSRLRIRR
jgi:hypothetical protein